MDDIARKWDRFSLNQKESQTVSLTPDVTGDGRVLVAKFFTKRHINMEVVFRTLKSMWKTEKSFDIRDLGSNTAMIIFYDEDDLDCILLCGPWSFDKYLLGLYKPGKNEAVKNASFDKASFWIQILDLPIQHMSKANAEAIGSTLGLVEQVDTDAKGDCRGRCLRVRINIDINQPLCRGRMVDIGASSPSWVSFQYERLPIFCYWCGILNHDEKDCKLWLRSKCTLRKEEQQYGAWLRASMERHQKNQIQSVRPSRTATNTTETPTDTVTTTVDGEPPTNPTNFSAVTGDKGCAKFTVTDTHKHIPTNTVISNNPESFHSHPAVIDQYLNANVELAEVNPMITDDSIKAHAPHEKPPTCDVTTANATLLTSQGEVKINNGFHIEPIRAMHIPTARAHRKCKRISHDHAANSKMSDGSMVGSKRKLELTDRDVDSNKKQKLDTETRILGKIFAEQLGSAVAAAQHRRVQ